MDITEQDQKFSLTLSPEVFCAFCLQASPPKVEFYKYVTGGFVELPLSFQSILGYDFQLDSFAICKPCWSLVQLFQDFRARCQKATSLVEQIGGHGLKSDGYDDWFGEKNLEIIESLQMVIQDQLAQIEKFDVPSGEVGMIKTEPLEIDVEQVYYDEVKAEESSQQNKDVPAPAFHMVEIKVDNDYDEDEATEPMNEVVEEMEPTVQQEIKAEDDYNEDEATESMNEEPEEVRQTVKTTPEHSNEKSSEQDEQRNGTLVECKKCNRMFGKMKNLKLHLKRCDGTQPSRLYTCELCKASFLERRLLNTHMNKHEGKTPFPCRKLCKASFISAQIRNRHETTCSKDCRKCTLCEEVLPDHMRLFAHYRQVHPGELRYPCSTCGKRFKRRNALASHERRLHSENRVKSLPCQICGKKFAELDDVKGHIKVVHEKLAKKHSKPAVQCELCGKQLCKQNSLNIHMAAAHPEQTSEANLEAYRRRCQQNMERKRRLKLEEKG